MKQIEKKKPKGGKGGTKCLIALAVALLPVAANAMEQCQVFSDGAVVCYPTGGGSTYGR